MDKKALSATVVGLGLALIVLLLMVSGVMYRIWTTYQQEKNITEETTIKAGDDLTDAGGVDIPVPGSGGGSGSTGGTGSNPPDITAPPPTGVCKGVDVTAYQKYSSDIADAVQESGLADTLKGTGFDGVTLMASLITQESGAKWNERAVSPCGSAGLNQFIPPTGRAMGLNVPKYDLAECNMALCKMKVAVCNSCTPDKCQYDVDERFDPHKSILASAKYLNQVTKICKTVAKGVAAYNGGPAYCKEANAGYTQRILEVWYPRWAACLAKAE
jgi:hypothetical protein